MWRSLFSSAQVNSPYNIEKESHGNIQINGLDNLTYYNNSAILETSDVILENTLSGKNSKKLSMKNGLSPDLPNAIADASVVALI